MTQHEAWGTLTSNIRVCAQPRRVPREAGGPRPRQARVGIAQVDRRGRLRLLRPAAEAGAQARADGDQRLRAPCGLPVGRGGRGGPPRRRWPPRGKGPHGPQRVRHARHGEGPAGEAPQGPRMRQALVCGFVSPCPVPFKNQCIYSPRQSAVRCGLHRLNWCLLGGHGDGGLLGGHGDGGLGCGSLGGGSLGC